MRRRKTFVEIGIKLFPLVVALWALLGEPPAESPAFHITPTVLAAGVSAPVLMWQYGGCRAGPSCQTGWYSSPAVADLDGDGRPDVIWGAYDVVALNGADGSLKWRGPSTRRVWPDIAVADLTGDGTREVIVGRDADQLTVYNRLGSVMWTRNPFGGGELRTLAVADLENDRQLEIFVGTAGGPTFQLNAFEPNGSVRTGWPVRHAGEPGSGGALWNENVAVADMKGDGFKQAFFSTGSSSVNAVDRNGNQLTVNPAYAPRQFWSEVGVGVDNAVDLRGWANCGIEHRPDWGASAPVIADVNGDGVPELIIVGNVYNCGTTPYTDLYHMPFIFKADHTRWSGSGFDWTAIPTPRTGSGPRSEDFNVIENIRPNAVVADLDGDGFQEILFPSYDGKVHAYWLDKTEHGSWPYTIPTSGTAGDDFRFAGEPIVVDLDNDGHAEVIFTSWPKKATGKVGQLHILDYQGVELQRINLPASANGAAWNGGMGAPTIANIDADADLEVVVGTTGSGVVAYKLPNTANARVLWGTGRSNFERTGAPVAAPLPPLDSTPPTVALMSPANGATVNGTLSVTASAADNVGVVGVQFRVDGANLGVEDTTAPYAVLWNTATASNGSHTLTAVARDAAGNTTTSAAVTVTVFNDTTAPTVSITAPATGATVSGTVTVTAGASDNVGVAGVQFVVDGGLFGAEDTTAPYAIAWNTTTASNGSHTLTARARDAAGNTTTSAVVTVTVANDTTAPTVSITAPANGATVSGSMTVTANAADNVGVAGVQFVVDGSLFGAEDTTAPYAIAWNTAVASNGSHTLAARARDAAGNTTTSTAVTVTVANDTTPPTVSITAPATGATVSGTMTVTANAADNVGVAGVQSFVDGAPLGGEASAAPYTVAWDTTAASSGSHTLTARARDAAGNTTTSAIVTVTVANDTTPPTVSITAPANGASVSGTMTVTANAADSVGVAGVQFFLDGAPLGGEAAAAPYSVTWDITTASSGSHTLTARARDAAGNTTTSTAVTVTVANDPTPPTVSITAPANGATVSGTTTVTASASDNVGVAGVQFFVDGAPLGGEASAVPYSVAWDTATGSNASHTLTARARDAAGNTATSAAVIVTVANNTGGTSRIEETTTAVSYLKVWTQNFTGAPGGWSGGSIAFSVEAGGGARLSFTGTGVRWISRRGPSMGIATVSLDGAAAATVDAYAPTDTVQAVLYTSPLLAAGSHTLAIGVPRTKNAASSDFLVVVDAFDVTGAPPDTTAPAVTITSPTTGASVSGTATVRADAADNTDVVGVQFFVDGSPLAAEDTTVSYAATWNTTTVLDGSHTLTAVARDGMGNTASSAPVAVTVSNAAPPPAATRIENTDLSILYTSGIVGPGQPPDWFSGSRSRGWSAGTASFNRSAGARATFTFTGTAVSWIGFRAPWAGIARVFVDDQFVSELDLYATSEQVQTPVFTATNLAAGTHTLAVESTGRNNPSAVDFAVVVDAFDVTPGFPPPVTGTRVEETAAATTFTSGWTPGNTTKAWSGGSAAVSATPPVPGARASFTFVGTTVSWIGQRGPQNGIARVFLDGAFQATVDAYAPTDIQAVVYTAPTLAAARHTLAIEVTGQSNPAATGSLIAVDAFDVRSRFEDTDPAIAYTGSWTPDTNRAWSGNSLNVGAGTAMRSATAGSRAEFTFTGTSVSWIGFRAPWVGMADVSVDGGAVTRIDLYAPTEMVQVPVFTATGLAAGRHTLRIDVPGMQNPASIAAWVMVDAFDAVPATAPPVTRVQETDPSLVLTTDWTQSGQSNLWSGENARQSVTVGGQATFTFTGTSLRWIGERGFGTGLARVSLDGVFIAQVDTSTTVQEEYQAVLFSATGLTAGSHTLTIAVVGRNNQPPGTTVERVVVDAFDVY